VGLMSKLTEEEADAKRESMRAQITEALRRKELFASTPIVVAFIKDRAAQYELGSGIVAALEELAEEFRKGEHVDAYMHGELYDLLPESEQA
jgi:hypothetical protein